MSQNTSEKSKKTLCIACGKSPKSSSKISKNRKRFSLNSVGHSLPEGIDLENFKFYCRYEK